MNTKNLSGIEVKDAAQGIVTAVFSTLGEIDSDGDVTMPGAFAEGAPVVISAYGHSSWSDVLPVGAGTIHTVGNQAILDGQFFMDVPEARSTFLVVNELAKRGQGEWSYGYDPTEYSYGEQDGQSVRFLKQLNVFECSPVLRGSGVGTMTLTSKSQETPLAAQALAEWRKALAVQVEAQKALSDTRKAATERVKDLKQEVGGDVVDRKDRTVVIAPHRTTIDPGIWDTKAVKALPDDERPSTLRSIHAWCDPDANPERKSSYRIPHHHGPDTPANLRAVVAGAAALNAPDGAGVPEADRKAAYEHLAAHMRDADMDPLDFGVGPVSGLKFFDHGAVVLAAVTGFVDRASEVMALRATKAKGFSPGSADLLSWVEDELIGLKTLLAPPPPVEEPLRDDELSTLAAAVASVQNL